MFSDRRGDLFPALHVQEQKDHDDYDRQYSDPGKDRGVVG